MSHSTPINMESLPQILQNPLHPFIGHLHHHFGKKLAKKLNNNKGHLDLTELWLAQWLDEEDPLRALRAQFHVPRMGTLPGVDFSLANVNAEEECVYLCGNSLGLQPKCTEQFIQKELKQWAEMGVHGHFQGPEPWIGCDDCLLEIMGDLVGAKSPMLEVGIMNATTVNIHILFAAFFRPSPTRYKVLVEDMAFPSDYYAVGSQLRLNGLDPKVAMICMRPREGEECLRTEDILAVIEREGHSIALLFFSAIHYYTGQLFDIERITKCAQQKGCLVGWDLAHAIANVPLHLHEWNVDFAAWCNYKYACAGPGGVGGLFVHERYAKECPAEERRLLGWWGHRLSTRFQMSNRMELAEGAAGFRLSTPSPILMAGMRGFCHIFRQTTMPDLRRKSLLLTGYLEFLLDTHFGTNLTNTNGTANREMPSAKLTLITPRDPAQRGCQLSLKFNGIQMSQIYEGLVKRGVVVDERHPDVIRVAPVHLYNSFDDCWRFVRALGETIEEVV